MNIEQAAKAVEASRKNTRLFKKHEKHTHSTSFIELAIPGEAPLVGKIYAQSWFVGDAETILVTVEPVKP